MRLLRRSLLASRQAGGALVMTLIVAGVVAILSAAILQLTMGFTRKQVYSEHDTRAFYLAEAGISEAYRSLARGGTGQIGSRAAPAASGDGLLWVDATPRGDGVIELACTALVGLGRASLAVVVDRDEVPVGFFSNQGLTFSAPILADGFDSEDGPYIEQTVIENQKLKKVALDEFIAINGDVWPYQRVKYKEQFWLLVDRNEKHVYLALLDETYSDSGDDEEDDEEDDDEEDDDEEDDEESWGSFCKAHGYACGNPIGAEPDSDEAALHLAGGGSFAPSMGGGFSFLDTALTASADETLSAAAAAGETAAKALGGTLDLPHTDRGARIVSNGAIRFESADTHVFGDVLPGPQEFVSIAAGATVSGTTASRERSLVLDPVAVPARTLEDAVDHASLVPWVAPEGDSAYAGLRVQAGAEAILRGPATIVLGALELQPGAKLTIENGGGTVLLYVLGDVTFALGSIVEVQSERPSELNLLGAGDGGAFDLSATARFHGLVYAPRSTVHVGTEFEIFGAAIADLLTVAPGARLHFDSSATSGAVQLPRLVFWEISEIPPEISAHRRDAFDFFSIDETTLRKPTEAGESHSWVATVEYKGMPPGFLKPAPELTYEGPLEQFDFRDMLYVTSLVLEPPDVTHASPWTGRIVYWQGFMRKTFEGPLTDFPAGQATSFEEIHLTPPDELLEFGFTPTSMVKTP